MSKLEKFLVLIFFVIFILTFIRIVFINLFLKRFYLFYILVGILILFNIFICFFLDLFFTITVLIILSFCSLFVIILGYGISFEICFIIPFKLLADIFLILYLGNFLFVIDEWEIMILINFYNFSFIGNLFLLLAFFIYSLCGILGFWIYWAMEGSYFISCYLHSVGFILISTIIFVKMYYLGLLEDFSSLIYKLEIFFFFSFLFFLMCFLVVKKIKKGFGYFSCSGVSFVFLLLLISPTIGIIYFFLSSLFKVIFFELMGIIYGRFLMIKKKMKYNELPIVRRVKFIYFFLIFSTLGIIFLIYGEFFYFYLCSDWFMDYFFINNFLRKLLFIFFSLKVLGVFNLFLRINVIFFKNYFSSHWAFEFNMSLCKFRGFGYMTEGSRIKSLLFLFLLLYFIFNYLLNFYFHFINFFIIVFGFMFYSSSFYRVFKISSLEYSMKFILLNFYYFFLNKKYFKFYFRFARRSFLFFSFLKSNNIFLFGLSFFLVFMLFIL